MTCEQSALITFKGKPPLILHFAPQFPHLPSGSGPFDLPPPVALLTRKKKQPVNFGKSLPVYFSRELSLLVRSRVIHPIRPLSSVSVTPYVESEEKHFRRCSVKGH